MGIEYDSIINETELEGERTRTLQKLRVGSFVIRSADGTFNCPFCPVKKKQGYKLGSLLQHASSVAESSKKLKEKASHQAVVTFLLAHLNLKGPQSELHQIFLPDVIGKKNTLLSSACNSSNVCEGNGKIVPALEYDEQEGDLVYQASGAMHGTSKDKGNFEKKYDPELIIEQLMRLNKELKSEIERLQSLNQTHILKERRSNEELQATHKKLIESKLIIEQLMDQNENKKAEIDTIRALHQTQRRYEEVQASHKKLIESEFIVRQIMRQNEDQRTEIEHLQSLNQTLILKERRSNEELQATRKEFIEGWKKLPTRSQRYKIGVRRMGEISPKPFVLACKRKFPLKEVKVKATELYSRWQDDYLQDPGWHPFKRVRVDEETDEVKEEILYEDERLKELKSSWGKDVHEAVTKALVEMNEYNPSGRYCVDEMWHFKENRKAALPEAMRFALRQMQFQAERCKCSSVE